MLLITYLVQVFSIVSQEQRVGRIGLDHFQVISADVVRLGSATEPAVTAATARFAVLVHSSAWRSELLPRRRPVAATVLVLLHLGYPRHRERPRAELAKRSHLRSDDVRLRGGAADAPPRHLRVQGDMRGRRTDAVDGDGEAGRAVGGSNLDRDRTGAGSEKERFHGLLFGESDQILCFE